MMTKLKQMALRIFLVCTGNPILYRTKWYRSFFVDVEHQIYPSNIWYREHDERNFDVVNLGSSSALHAFDYSQTGVRGMNWAQKPQTLLEDYNLLRNFHSILRKGGYVLITIMPFTSLNKETGIKDAMKYLKLGTHSPIQPMHLDKARLYAEYPILFRKPAVRALFRYILGKDNLVKSTACELEHNPMNAKQLENDALMWINGWKKQFGILDFDAPLTEINQQGRKYRIQLMRELVDFCLERNYKPVYVIPPVTKYLSSQYSEQFQDTYIYSYLKEVERDVQILDYSKDDELQKESLYFNSFFMNKKGATLFTKRVMMDLDLIK